MKRKSDFHREVTPPDQLSSYSNGTPTGKDTDPVGEDSSSLPNGDSARNIGRPSPDSPNLKYRDLDRKRPPAEKADFGYVHDSGSGSARVIPYDSGFANNSSVLRSASQNVPVDEKLWADIQALAKGESDKPVTKGGQTVNPVNGGAGFTTFPSAYANGWALAQYKRLGGKWKREGGYKMPRKWDRDHCESKSCDEMGFSEKASCRPYVDCYGGKEGSKGQDMISRVAERFSAKRDDPKMKNTGKGGLGTWFAGHGGGNPDDRATWGDWIAITPIKHTITKDDGEKKTYEAGDIVGPCAVSSEPDWASVTSGGKKPLKCMPREKAWGMSKEERAELAKNKRREEAKHRGQKPVNTPTFSEKAKEVTDKKASAESVALRYARAQPAQDLAGIQTWVTKTRQDQINNDTTTPEKGREDYQDGKPQRDRVLPLPSGHPEGRDEHRVGPPVINSPPDSSGQGGASRKPKDPSALKDQPDGKALHERPRSSGIPGDQYGHPYIDQGQSTGLKRRVDAQMKREMLVEMEPISFWDLDEEGELIKVSRISIQPPRRRQRKQKGQVKRRYLKWKRKNRVKYRRNLIKLKRDYASNKGGKKTRMKLRNKRVRKNPYRFKRYQGGGVSTPKQKSQRDKRNRKANMNDQSLTALQLTLACLRSAHWAIWNSHWQVKGSNFYGNHLLLERVYTSLVDEIDTLAEKIICTYGSSAISPVDQAHLMANRLLPLAEAEAHSDPFKRALIIEEALQKVFKGVYDLLKETDSLSLGMDDFIMSIANAHETNLYLLRQVTR